MAGPTITVAVLTDKADKAAEDLKAVGKAADTMADDVKDASGKVDDALDGMASSADESSRRARRSTAELGEQVEGLDGRANSAERGFRGLSDSINGTNDVMGGLASGNVVQLGMGMADLFGAVQDLFLPLLQSLAVKLGLVTVATETQTTAQEASNVAMAANPIGIVVLALVALAAAFYVAWTKSETFREIVTGAFDAVAGAAEATFGWIRDHWPLLLAILTGPFGLAVLAIVKYWDDIVAGVTGIPGRIAGAASGFYSAAKDLGAQLFDGLIHGVTGVGDAIATNVVDGFKAVVNRLIDAVNAFQIHIHIDPLGRFGPSIDFDWNGLGLPRLAQGGIVKARPGGTLLIAGEAGKDEAIVPLGAGGVGSTTIYYPAGYNRRQVTEAERRWRRLNPGP